MDEIRARKVHPLILATASLPAVSGAEARIPELELARGFNGTLIDYNALPANPRGRMLEKKMRLDWSLAKVGLAIANGHNVIFSASETVGLPLLALQKKSFPPHVMLAHHLLSPWKFRAVRKSGLLRKLAFLVCLSGEELSILQQQSGLPADRIMLCQGVCTDQHFFQPSPGHGEGFVLSTGATQRDYPLLMRALGGLKNRVLVAAGSQWVQGPAVKGEIPSNFTFLPSQSLSQMRDLYARCAVVVVPLRRGTQFSAGRTNVTEAMASAKPVVATDLPGMRDFIAPGQSGLLVKEGEASALREAVAILLADEEKATAFGRAGRKAVEEQWNIEVYVEFLSRVLMKAAGSSRVHQP